MKTIFTLENIRDFLKKKYGIDWGCEVWDRKTGKTRRATIEDFDYTGRYDTTELAFSDKNGIDYYLEAYVSDYKFITYKDLSDVRNSNHRHNCKYVQIESNRNNRNLHRVHIHLPAPL